MVTIKMHRFAVALVMLATVFAPLPAAWAQHVPRDILDYRGSPSDTKDRSFNIFFDAGAWHGYSLPPQEDAQTGFVGPFVHSLHGGRWVGDRFAQIELRDARNGAAIALDVIASESGPGYLRREFAAPGLRLRQTLFFADAWQAVVRIELESTASRKLVLRVSNHLLPTQEARVNVGQGAVRRRFLETQSELSTWLTSTAGDTKAQHQDASEQWTLTQPIQLQPDKPVLLSLVQSLRYDVRHEAVPALDVAQAWAENQARWAGYVGYAQAAQMAGLPAEAAQHVALKSIMTLIGNWRAARGDLHHDGVIPAYSYPGFNGFWAWDSWKHAVALAGFAPELARDQIRSMFDYQREDGMVIDCIFLDAKENNARDSKPPLASWAILTVYRATHDAAFLAEMYPKLVRYHRWWYAQRDHDGDGLVEYGSTDGTRIAAAWESGMDNAVRFDHAKMLQNGPGAWSLDQASADLNAYLYREKLELGEMADALGKGQDALRWHDEANTLKAHIQARFYDAKNGWFFDRSLATGQLIRVFGSDGWTPLWAGAATDEQANSVIQRMLRPDAFASLMPFPTLTQKAPEFSPVKGYWRGPVWMDQAYYGVEALRRYGFAQAADTLALRLVTKAQGLTKQGPIYENYDPLTGNGYQARNFSWSAASFLLLVHGEANPAR